MLVFCHQKSVNYLEKAWALEDQGKFDDAERVYRKVTDAATLACDKTVMYSCVMCPSSGR